MTKALWFFRIYAAICLVLAGLIGDVAVFAAHIAKPGPEPQILSLVNATGEDVLADWGFTPDAIDGLRRAGAI